MAKKKRNTRKKVQTGTPPDEADADAAIGAVRETCSCDCEGCTMARADGTLRARSVTPEEEQLLTLLTNSKISDSSSLRSLTDKATKFDTDEAFRSAATTAGYDFKNFQPLLEDASNGKRYRQDLLSICHATGVRAFGTSYDQTRNDLMLANLSPAQLQEEIMVRRETAKVRFGKDDPTKDEEPLRGKLEDRVGGRQTVPHNNAAIRQDNDEAKKAQDKIEEHPASNGSSAFKIPTRRNMS